MKSSKSNINFDYFEFEISEKDLEFFKNSIAQGCIRRVDQVTINKWHYLLKADDKLLEVEVSYNRNNIKQFNCACGAHSPGKFCKHVKLVSYWHVNTIRSKNGSANSSHNATSLDLSNSSEEDLRYYISFLSKQNKIDREWLYFFDRARGISSNPFQKYISLIEHFFQFITIQTRNSVSKIKYILQLFEELYFISFYHYKKSNIEESIHALLAGIDNLHEWHFNLDWKNQSRLIAINEKMHIALEQFLASIIAPRALNKYYKIISELQTKPEYLILNEKSNLFNIISLRFNKENQSKIYFNSLIDKLHLNIREEYKFNILDYLYKVYSIPLKDYLITIEINKSVYWVLSWFEFRKNKIPPDYLMELYSKIYEVSTKDMKLLVALRIAELYANQQDAKSGKLLIKYYLEIGSVKLLDAYFKDQDISPQQFTSFLFDLEESAQTTKLNLIQKLDLAFYSKQWSILINLLEQVDDFEYILKFDSKFPEEYQSQLLAILISLTKKYLETHVGQKSHIMIETISRHLKSTYRNKYFAMYINELKQLFPNRKLIPQF